MNAPAPMSTDYVFFNKAMFSAAELTELETFRSSYAAHRMGAAHGAKGELASILRRTPPTPRATVVAPPIGANADLALALQKAGVTRVPRSKEKSTRILRGAGLKGVVNVRVVEVMLAMLTGALVLAPVGAFAGPQSISRGCGPPSAPRLAPSCCASRRSRVRSGHYRRLVAARSSVADAAAPPEHEREASPLAQNSAQNILSTQGLLDQKQQSDAEAVLGFAADACLVHGLTSADCFPPDDADGTAATKAATTESAAAVDDAVTGRRILGMALPLLAVWLSAPLLSLIDTAAIGASAGASGALGLAALGPAISVCDTLSFLLSFLAVTATSIVARARAAGDAVAARHGRADGCVLGLVIGAAVGAALLAGGAERVLSLYLTPATAAVLPQAATYVRVRALAVPLHVGWQVLQAVAIARGSVMTPLRAVAAAGAANMLGDYLLVLKLGLGVGGAAWATVASIVAGFSMLALDIRKTEAAERASEAAADRDARSRPQRRAALAAFWAEAAPVLSTIAGKAAVLSMVTAAAAAQATDALAAHQVVMGLFCLICPVGDALAQTAQALLPGALHTHRKYEAARAAAGGDGALPRRGAAVSPPRPKKVVATLLAFSLALGVPAALLATAVAARE